MNIRVFLVGGAVRDKLMGLTPKDMDFAVEAPSFDAMRDWINKRGKIFVETPKFFTIRANVPGLGSADFVLCRKDGNYKDGRHPETVEVGSILDDLARRDFTVNAIAQDMATNELVDPFDGQGDIVRKLIKAVGNPMDRFAEDKLRMFRALRFCLTKHFMLDVPTRLAINEFVLPSSFDAVSTERIREELLKMFAANSAFAWHMLNQFPVLLTVVEQRGIWFKPTIESR